MAPLPSDLWSIHELLELVFSQLDDRSLARVACVCRLWSDIALDILWREVDDLHRLISLLAPFRKPEQVTDLQKFRRSLVPNDWEQFQRYARRVRRLTHDQFSGRSKSRYLNPSVFDEMARTCPRAEILPSLHSLAWYGGSYDRQEKSIFFMHSKIKRLSLQLHASPEVTSYIGQAAARASSAEHVEFRLIGAMQDVEGYLAPALPNFRNLQSISFPMHGLTSGVLTALSRMRHLRTISLNPPTESGNGERNDVMTFAPSLSSASLPALRRISFSAQIPHASHFLCGAFVPANLVYLYLQSVVVCETHEVEHLFDVVRTRCHSLVELSVDFIIGPGSPLRVPGPPLDERPGLRTLSPLFGAKRLTKFEFRWDYPLNLGDPDIALLALEWPALEVLVLNPEPIMEVVRPALTLNAFLPLARHCPRLRKLGLHIDATTVPTPNVSGRPAVPFQCLETLMLGVSPIVAVESAALFLSQLLPLGCELSSGLRWPDAFGIALDHAGIMDDRRLRLTDYWVRWNDVAKVLPLATKARQQERARMETLQRDLEAMTLSRDRERQRSEELEQEVHGWRNRVGRRS
ncbi:hypothetical protein CERSUDRAFT_156889 [Gelatoporia subvermispora B]|uniref:F-box domain-containing protein n=1 Tax=Ceriporiopsis subvermispora (strain B) TaxID=914234 RepID=M2RCI1_CERS8|nr:hypothetical protein CERSUDRAFT_156889 [Gelatoporia subvermispora B]